MQSVTWLSVTESERSCSCDCMYNLKSRFYNQEYQVQDSRSNAVFASSAEKAAHMIAVTKCFEISRQCDVRDNKIEPDDLRMPQPCLNCWKRYIFFLISTVIGAESIL